MKRRLKLGAGVLAALLAALVIIWPSGDIDHASRLLGRGDYSEAAPILASLSLERPSDKRVQRLFLQAVEGLILAGDPQGAFYWLEMVKGANPRERDSQLLYTRALAASGHLDQAYSQLYSLFNKGSQQDLVQATLEFIQAAAAVEAWGLAVEAWSWLISAGYNPPQEEFQIHLGLYRNLEALHHTDQRIRTFVLSAQDPRHPLAMLAGLSHNSSIEELLKSQEILKTVDWQAFGLQVVEKANYYYSLAHLAKMAEEQVSLVEGLDAAQIDLLLYACWIRLRTDYSIAVSSYRPDPGSFEDYFNRFLESPSSVFSDDPLLEPVHRIWQAALSGELNTSGSEAARYLSNSPLSGYLLEETYRFQSSVQEFGLSPNYTWAPRVSTSGLNWSPDGRYLAIRHMVFWEGDQQIHWVILCPQQGISLVVSGQRLYWSPQGHSLLIQDKARWYLYPSPESEPKPLAGVNILGWWHQNQLSSQGGEIYNIDLVPAGKRVRQNVGLQATPQYSVSAADLRQVQGRGHTILFNSHGQMLAGFGGVAGIWSPAGDRVLTQTRVLGPAGTQDLKLPVGSIPMGWLDDERIMALRNLGLTHRYFTYNLSTDKILYLPELSIPENYHLSTPGIYPRGDGKSIAWVIEGEVIIGELKSRQ